MRAALLSDTASLRAWRDAARRAGETVGFVPTMGALHEGHLSLAREARRAAARAIVSIFVNPLQFGPGEDFERYPRNLDADLALLEGVAVDAVYAPSVADLYPAGFSTYVAQEGATEALCGASRPGHFRGVTTVVAKLFHLVEPDVAIFGQKDAQQAAIIRRMTADLHMPIRIVVCPIVREADGLAMSSRNAYLSPPQREQAAGIHRALCTGRDLIAAGERRAGKVIVRMQAVLTEAGPCRPEYIAVVDPETLADVHEVSGPVLLAIAVHIGATRLIDNMQVA